MLAIHLYKAGKAAILRGLSTMFSALVGLYFMKELVWVCFNLLLIMVSAKAVVVKFWS